MINTRNREPGQMQGDTQEPTGPGREAEREGQRGPPNGGARGLQTVGCGEGGHGTGTGAWGVNNCGGGGRACTRGRGPMCGTGQGDGAGGTAGGAWDTRCTVFPRLRDTGPCSIKRNSIKYLRVTTQL